MFFARRRGKKKILSPHLATTAVVYTPLNMRTLNCHHGHASVRSVGGQLLRMRRQPFQWHRSISSTTSTTTSEPVIFSGIQPTGVPHLGNYLGALHQWVKLQDYAKPGAKLLFSIVDLHALTVPQDAAQLRKWRREAFATLLAVGLDPKRSTIFYQSAVRDPINDIGEQEANHTLDRYRLMQN